MVIYQKKAVVIFASYSNFTRSEFYSIFASLVLSSSDHKNLRAANFIQIHLFALFRPTKLIPPFFYFQTLNLQIHHQEWKTPLKKYQDLSKFNIYWHFDLPYWIRHLLFSNCKLRFVIGDMNNC